MIHVLATITTKPGLRERVRKELRAIVPTVHAENGCVEYGPAIDAEKAGAVQAGAVQTTLGPDVFVVVEKWDTVEALNAHLAAPHMTTYAEKTKDLVLEHDEVCLNRQGFAKGWRSDSRLWRRRPG